MGDGFAFDIELRRGAGAYICGEETALFNSIEGKRGEPRNKPPFPVSPALFGKPTSINNVETLINVLQVLRMGPEAYAALGTEGSTGPRGCSACRGTWSGPGVYEHEHGVTLGASDRGRGRRPRREAAEGGPARRRRGRVRRPRPLDIRLTFEDARAGGYTLGSGVIMVFDEATDLVDLVPADRAVLPRRVVRPVRAVPGRDRPPGGGAAPARRRPDARLARATSSRCSTTSRQVMRDASICGLGQTAASAVQSAIATFGLFDGGEATRVSADPGATCRAELIDVEIDGETVRVARGRDDPRRVPRDRRRHADAVLRRQPDADQRLPRLRRRGRRCARRSRRLLAAQVEPDMKVPTDTERVRHSRKLVMEFLGSSVDTTLASTDWHRWQASTRRDPDRFGARMAPLAAGERDAREPGHHHDPDARGRRDRRPAGEDRQRAVRARLLALHPLLQVRRGVRGRRAAHVRDRRGRTRVRRADLDRVRRAARRESACVYCGNCIGVCPTGALMFKSEHDMREAGTWDEAEQTITNTICPYCGVGCELELHVQDNEIVKVTSPADHSVTNGHLCVKGRFGFQFVQSRKATTRPREAEASLV